MAGRERTGRHIRLVLWIPDGTPLAAGRLPVDAQPGPGGVQVRVDALGFAALLASAGHVVPLAAVLAGFAALARARDPRPRPDPHRGGS